ncbi:MAG: 6-phospho-beta-glucosidase [Clostridiales bacterium]|mgnify:CR=1 FL=1|nr:6-phospho-beta-glucosidase [Clostridiales bacterium]
MKLCVIGGGGGRSMFLAKSIAQRAEALGITELVFMDIDPDKLALFGGMAQQVGQMIAPNMRLRLTTEAQEAISGADHVITTLRVGGDQMRTRDEHIALDEGVLGQETTGAAGFSFAMRSIPALMKYCDMVRKYAKPGARVFNFTNPVGIVSQALRDAGYDFTYGICDAPSGMMHQFADLYGADISRMEADLFGLNHLSWFHTITLDGKNLVPDLLTNPKARQQTDLRFFTPDLLQFLGYVPNEYLYYYYYREQAVRNILQAGKTRGDIILDINSAMQQEMAGIDPHAEFDRALSIFTKWYGEREAQYMAKETGVKRDKPWRFDPFKKDDGGYAGVALNFIDIMKSGKKGSMVLTVPNQGAVDFLLDTDTVEVTCDIDSQTCTPRRFPKVPADQRELVSRVKFYERTGAKAIVERSRKLAVQALMLHPLVNSYSLADKLSAAYIALNEGFTGPWGA